MKISLLFLISAFVLAASWAVHAQQSKKHHFYDQLRDRDIQFKLWFPAAGQPSPLVVISHGSEGEYSNHYWLINHLVVNGYAVLGLNHPNNTTRNRTPEGVVKAWERPLDITRLLDHVLANNDWSKKLIQITLPQLAFHRAVIPC